MTLVGNDSGGAYSQIAAAARPERIARLALNSCETPHDEFPPPPFDGLPAAARDTATLGTLLGALRDPAVRSLPGGVRAAGQAPARRARLGLLRAAVPVRGGRAPGHREGDVLGHAPSPCTGPGAR